MRVGLVAFGVVCVALLVGGIVLNWQTPGHDGVDAVSVDFNRDIRPILNDNCTACHGGVKEAGGVSFIFREQVLGKGNSGRPVVVPGRPRASEMIARVTSDDPAVRMPLDAPPLEPERISLLKQWIEEGASWEDYWAFVPPDGLARKKWRA